LLRRISRCQPIPVAGSIEIRAGIVASIAEPESDWVAPRG
jgi:hypothetical protein